MVEQLTADLLEAFIYGLIAALISASIFEYGDRYAKTAWSRNQFAGKIEALPFFLATFFLGLFVKYGENVIGGTVSDIVYSFVAGQRVGIILIVGMIAFNHSITNFRYSDGKSLVVMGIGALLIFYPDLLYILF